MTISINDKILQDYDIRGTSLTFEELLTCLIVMVGKYPNDVMNLLIEKGVIIEDMNKPGVYYVHSEYQFMIKKILLQSDKNVPEINDLTELTEKLQQLFPKERKPDHNGVPKYSYRGNKRDVTERLMKFFKLYGTYSFDDVYECTKRYVDSFKYDKTYMKILPYFIIKDGESQLATELENMEDEPMTIDNPNTDWTNTLL